MEAFVLDTFNINDMDIDEELDNELAKIQVNLVEKCKYCGSHELLFYKKGKHIGCKCTNCYKWLGWVKQTPYILSKAVSYNNKTLF